MSKKEKKVLFRVGISTITLIIGVCIEKWTYVSLGFLLLSYLSVSYDIVFLAIKNIFKGKVFDENFLMSIATIGALALKDYPEAVFVMLLYQVGEVFQSYSVGKSRKSIASLMDIRPDYANIMVDGNLTQVDPEEVKIGDIIIVKPGERVPLDGIIIEGYTTIDTMALTGESMPRDVKVNDNILSGCINLTGVLNIQVTKEFGESTVAKILELVETASEKKAKSEKFISKFAKYYTPLVVIAATLLSIIPPLIMQDNSWLLWFKRSLTFLVISCPCALVISVPLSFFGGLGASSKAGILIKGSNYIEVLAKTEIVVFDKTGTLTKGSFEVSSIVGDNKEELLKYAAYAEAFSNHPIALSIKRAYKENINQDEVTDVKEIIGQGIRATVFGNTLYVGNARLMESNNINYLKTDEIGTIIHVASDKKHLGYLVISDELKESTLEAINLLKNEGIKKLVMLTGDNEVVATSIASKLGLNEYYYELLPGDKVNKVEELLKENPDKKIAFVGDGINDAPVLTMSDIGIAMGALGSDAAIEAADVVIMDDDLMKIASSVDIAKRTIKIVWQNIIFALGVKAFFLALGALGIASMWEAVFADVGVTFIVILNSMRALVFNSSL